jgi:hypothetical protein
MWVRVKVPASAGSPTNSAGIMTGPATYGAAVAGKMPGMGIYRYTIDEPAFNLPSTYLKPCYISAICRVYVSYIQVYGK